MSNLPSIARSGGARALPRRTRRILELGRRLKIGTLHLTLPGGERLTLPGSEPGPEAVINIRRARVMRRFLLGGHLAFAESYLDGDWDSPDLAALLLYFLKNEPFVDMEGSWWLRLAQRVLHRLRSNSRRRARDNIAAHYDLGNDFYRRWPPSSRRSTAISRRRSSTNIGASPSSPTSGPVIASWRSAAAGAASPNMSRPSAGRPWSG
jgi:cyclopropane-fatty-acyl-phospholipid synthase